ncbi:MAG: hypothetical protein A3E87_10960 [Gammaproteobacteria bacterium RIFCSPHIGHO2_12_FULL_35_23]|nr:MAG: hypothetical protein A3E87_10960 [Gammaproteobacteria bacterium RIFCSPHIGHO2_12_FULL_35_23]
MKIPLKPPAINELMYKLYHSKKEEGILEKLLSYSSITEQKEYIHWDKLRHLEQPKNWSAEEAWLAIKLARSNLYKPLPFIDKHQQLFRLATPDNVLQQLYTIDCYFGRTVQSTLSILNTDWRDTYLVSSLIEEAITSSQLEGASTTRKVAKAMLRSHRKPCNPSEQMIVNNYRAMQFIREIKNETLTVELLFELHRILTEKTLPEAECGALCTNKDDIHVWDNRDETVLHIPPDATGLKIRVERICHFANLVDNKSFIHPVIKAIILHFMLAYDHPFVDGNGRTARALFYWYLLKNDYWLIEFISISKVIKNAPAQYVKAFLYTETDDNDTTYFITHQLDTILKAFKSLQKYLEKQISEIKETERLLHSENNLYQRLNYRQVALLKHALKHPNHYYSIEEHRSSHNVTYETARSDLLKLSELKLFQKEKLGKAFIFTASRDLKKKLEGYHP